MLIKLTLALLMPAMMLGSPRETTIAQAPQEVISEDSELPSRHPFDFQEYMREKGDEIRLAREEQEAHDRELARLAEIERQNRKQTVNFTSYVGTRTSTGIPASEFTQNEFGMAVDRDGYIVLAGATSLCLQVKSGPCGQYNHLPNGYRLYNLGDVVEFTINADIYSRNGEQIIFKGKVQDSCGACFWEEAYQRVDIFMFQGSMGLTRGGAVILD